MEMFKGHTANQAWSAAAVAFNSSHTRSQTSRLGPTREIPQAAFVIEDSQQRWVQSRIPPVNIALALAEVIWIVCGRSDTRFLSAWSRSYAQYVSAVPQQHDAYGRRLRSHFGMDQLTRAAAALSSNPDTRQVVLQLWDASKDLPWADGSPADPNVPCNVVSILKVREGRLEWTQVLRSNDFFRGTPYNFMQFTTLQELVAGWIGTTPGTYTHISDSLHVYEHELQLIRGASQSEETWTNTDSLAFNMNDCLQHFSALEQVVDKVSNTVKETELVELADHGFPTPLANFVLVFVAERMRQLHLYRTAQDTVQRCTNPYLTGAWRAWADHLQHARR
jgi:thymidylate synthase